MKPYLQLSGTKIGWPDHFSNGGTGVTKFGSEEGPEAKRRADTIREAVKQFNDPAVWIVENNPPELHTTLNDLGKFWAIRSKLLEAQP